MARGYPDYNNPVYGLAAKNIDFDILATAIMGAVPVDGRGRVYWFDNFREGPYAWVANTYGDAGAVVCSTYRAEIPPASLRFDLGTQAGDGAVDMARKVRLGKPYTMGIEASFRAYTYSIYQWLDIVYIEPTGGLRARVYIDWSTGAVTFTSDSGTHALTTIDVAGSLNTWVQIKTAIDAVNGKYIRLMIGNEEFDLSAYGLEATADTDDKVALMRIGALSNQATSPPLYIGHVIFTLDEP